MVVLFDLSSFIHRAFYALPPMQRPNGDPIGCVHGFVSIMIGLIKLPLSPTIAVACLDKGRDTFRRQIYAQYKAQRPPMPEELRSQIPLVHEAAAAFGLHLVAADGFEADDIIATYASQGDALGANVTIVTPDKDLSQLVTRRTYIYDPLRNTYIGEAEVIERFGVRPDQMVDYQALVGDSVDNVPGVPAIGAKTAAKLLSKFGTLDALLERTHEIDGLTTRMNLQRFGDRALLSRSLVRLATVPDLPDLQGLTWDFDPKNVRDFCERLDLPTLARNIDETFGAQA